MGLFGPPDVAKMKAKKDIKGLVKALGYQRDFHVREDAAKALGGIGDSRAVEPLIIALADRYAKLDAIGALGNIRDPRAVQPLIALLEKEADGGLWTDCIKALVKIGAPSVEPLIVLLSKWDSGVRRCAAEALEKLGWKPDRRETGAWYYIARCDWEGASAIGIPAVKPLIEVLKMNEDAIGSGFSTEVIWGAPQALGKIGAPAVKPLITALKKGDPEENWGLRMSISEALGRIGAPAVEPLIAALKSRDWSVRVFAAEALGAIGDTRAVEPLIAALKDEEVCPSAITALGRIGDPRAIEPLKPFRDDEDWSTLNAAAEALQKLGWKPGRRSK